MCSNYHENTMPETAFLGAQIAPKSLSAGGFAPDPTGGNLQRSPRLPSWIQGVLLLRLLLLRVGGEGRTPKIVHPEKFLRIGP